MMEIIFNAVLFTSLTWAILGSLLIWMVYHNNHRHLKVGSHWYLLSNPGIAVTITKITPYHIHFRDWDTSVTEEERQRTPDEFLLFYRPMV